MKIKKTLMIGLILIMLVVVSFAPVSITVIAATTDTITIEFDPQGNISIDVSPGTYNFSTFWSYSDESTGGTYFTIWNNGTADNMQTDIQITGSPASLTIDEDSEPTADDNYALYLIGGTASGINAWVKESATIQLDSDLDTTGTETFGFQLYISNITANHTWQSMTLTLTGSQA
ncbi:MAG: hypothetical protein JSV67_08505 [Thermoplasmatales archaeon]|jgi:hypothetical protein|nr:MAG: hypothetical protein JSV67_08505 [Thermoplasmatales archaeon]